jgi:hypothetical protein
VYPKNAVAYIDRTKVAGRPAAGVLSSSRRPEDTRRGTSKGRERRCAAGRANVQPVWGAKRLLQFSYMDEQSAARRDANWRHAEALRARAVVELILSNGQSALGRFGVRANDASLIA